MTLNSGKQTNVRITWGYDIRCNNQMRLPEILKASHQFAGVSQ